WTAAAAGTPAVKFNLYRAQDPAPEEFGSLVSGLTEPAYTDLPSQTATYYYRAAGVSAEGLEGEPSPPAGLFTDPLPPGHVSDLAAGQADPSDGSIVLSWTAPAEDHALGRYIIKDVTEGGWDGGTVLADVAASTGPGGRETFTLFFPSTETVRTLALRAVDAFGNESLYTSNNAFADFVPPRILSVSGAPEPGSMAGRPFTILVQAGDNHLVARRDILVDGELLESGYAGEGFYYSWPLTSFPDGWHTLSVVVLDAAGNSARWDLPLVVNYVPPPAPRIAWPTGETFQLNETSIDIYGESDPDIYASLFLDGVYYGSQPTSNGLFAFHGVPLPGDGSFVVTLQAADQKGSSPGSAPLTLIVDSGPPAPPAELSAEAGVYGGVKISW
ncbi:MAG TPA: hypothetical protein PKK31_04710, partial [Elusimicrobiales bacterium]|nr:hypothetical protein [Elusimicrobiales bacterium]